MPISSVSPNQSAQALVFSVNRPSQPNAQSDDAIQPATEVERSSSEAPRASQGAQTPVGNAGSKIDLTA